jgi:hypothetical protein
VANAITPQGRYLLLKAPNPIRDCREYLIVGYIDGVSTDLDVIPVTAGSASGFSLAALFDDQPGLYTTSLNFVGAWLRPRSAAIPMGFDDTTLARFSADNSITPAVTRSNLVSGGYLNAYYDWWFDQRKAYLNEVRDYLRTNVNEDAVVLYTYDHSESGVSHPSGQPGVITDDLPTWGDIVSGAMSYNAAVESELHYEAMTLPAYNWSYWEWPHAVPRGDAPNYQNNEGVMMEYVFNKMYTVPEPDWFQEYRTQSGLACIYHYCLNEDMMTNSSDTDIVGYFVSDMELAGPYCMLPEARAVANGDPYYIGYLSSNSFNRGFPGYAREFNANFLALPALEMTTETSATAVEGVVVRSITTQSDGTWLAIINTSFEDKEAVEITLPVSGAVTEAVTGDSVTVTGGKITLDLWPGQLKTLRIQ